MDRDAYMTAKAENTTAPQMYSATTGNIKKAAIKRGSSHRRSEIHCSLLTVDQHDSRQLIRDTHELLNFFGSDGVLDRGREDVVYRLLGVCAASEMAR